MITESSVYNYWKILKRRKLVIASSTLLTFMAVAVFTQTQPVQYEAAATIKVQQIVNAEELSQMTSVTAALRSLESADVAQKAAEKLGKIKTDSNPSDIARAVNAVQGAVHANALDEQGYIRITARHTDRFATADIANAMAEAYKEYEAEETGKQAKKQLENLSMRTEQVRGVLNTAEQAKQRYMERNSSAASSQILSNQLSELQLSRRELLNKYTDQHPDVIEINQRIESVKAQLDKIPAQETELARLDREVKANDELYTTLNKQYEEARITVSSIMPAVTIVSYAVPQNSPVSPNKPRNYLIGLTLGLILGVSLAFFFENLDLSISNIEEIERFLKLPVIGVISNLSFVSGPVRWPRKLLNIFRGSPREHLRQLMILSHPTNTKLVEPYHTLRANILSKVGRTEGGVSLMFTSSGSSEGKTLCSLNFAIAAAQAGLKTLLIDMDMRRSSLYRVLNLQRQPGFADVILGKANWRDAARGTTDFLMAGEPHEKIIYFPGIDNLKILTCGLNVPNKMDILENERLPLMLAEWKKNFDFIIFDTPPVLVFVDSLLLSKQVDCGVLVYGSGRVSRMALKRAKEQLESFADSKLLGVVINNLQTAEMGSHYFESHYHQ